MINCGIYWSERPSDSNKRTCRYNCYLRYVSITRYFQMQNHVLCFNLGFCFDCKNPIFVKSQKYRHPCLQRLPIFRDQLGKTVSLNNTDNLEKKYQVANVLISVMFIDMINNNIFSNGGGQQWISHVLNYLNYLLSVLSW